MPALRESLRKPQLWLGLILLLVILGLADANRAPGDQITAHCYVFGVRLYQRVVRPLTDGRIQCRYRPTCSEYSIRAVRRHGIGKGLAATWKRVRSCTPSVPMGTDDPVPQ